MLAIKWLHSRHRRYEKTGGSRIKEGGKGEGGFETYSSTALSFFIPSIFFFTRDGCMPSNAAESAGDREEISTTECIDSIQSGELQENKSEREGGLKNYLIRHRVWQILQERMEKSLEEKERMFFKENCARASVCTLACAC